MPVPAAMPRPIASAWCASRVTGQQIKDLKVEDKKWGQFYRSDGRAAGGELVTLKFSPKKGVRWMGQGWRGCQLLLPLVKYESA